MDDVGCGMRRFSPFATGVFAILSLLLCAWGVGTSPLSRLLWPGFSVVRFYDHGLDFATAMEIHAPGASELSELLGATAAETRAEAKGALQEVLDHWRSLPPEEADLVHEEERNLVQAHLTILLADEGRDEEARRHLEEIATRGSEGERFASLACAAYPELGPSSLPDQAQDEIPLLGWGWAARTAAARLRTQGVDPAIFGLPSEVAGDLPRVVERAARGLAAYLTVILIGLGAGLYLWLERGLGRVSNGFTVAPWPAATVVGVLARGLVYGTALSWCTAYAVAAIGWPLDVDVFAWLVWPLPCVYFVHRYLVRPGTWSATFGLQLLPRSGVQALLVALSVAGGSLGGGFVVDLVCRQLGLQVPWTDAILGPELYTTGIEYMLFAFSVVVWGPFVEEVCLRGLVYPTLRLQLRPRDAILVSAAIFAVMHPYSAAGLLTVTWSGILLAATYERTGSIVPGWVAHATTNGLWLLNAAALA